MPNPDYSTGILIEKYINTAYDKVVTVYNNIADVISVADNMAEILAADTSAASVAADLLLTNADVVSTNADAAATALDKIATNADVVLTNADLVATNQDTIDTSADLVATNQDTIDTAADLVLTNADVVTAEDSQLEAGDWANRAEDLLTRTFLNGSPTNRAAGNYSALHWDAKTAADAIATAADLVATNQDTIDTAADLVATNQDTIDTAADAAATALDLVATNQDAIDTAADLVATNQDTIDTAADLVATNLDVTYTAEWATRAEDSLIPVAAGGDGVTDYSAFHWKEKAAAIVGSGNGTFSIPITTTDDIVMDERADHASTPVAGKGIDWVKNTVPSSKMFTDDTGADHQLTNPTVSGHIRAGNMQIPDGDLASVAFVVSTDVAIRTYESVGPADWSTRGVAQPESTWAAMDNLPDNATMLIVDVWITYSSSAAGGASIKLYAVHGDTVSPSISHPKSLIAHLGTETDANFAGSNAVLKRAIIPLGATDQDFAIYWDQSAGEVSQVDLYYRGFMTD